jgi:hypothetical protein
MIFYIILILQITTFDLFSKINNIMKQMYRRLLLFIFATMLMSGSLKAQMWTVYVPVDTLLTQLGRNVGGCFPSADFTFTFPGSPVTGVDYLLIVKQTPTGTVNMTPIGGTIAINDTLVLVPGTQTYNVYCNSGTGLVSFDFVAKGTPLVANQAYPCSVSQLWLSNLMICPDGLSNNPPNNCLTQIATGLNEPAADDYNIIFPGDHNNGHLEVTGDFTHVMVTDINGRTFRPELKSGHALFNLSGVPAGMYTVIISNGSRKTTRKFSVL